MPRISHLILYAAVCLSAGGLLCRCSPEREAPLTALGHTAPASETDSYDLPRIQEAGELIAVTLSGPDTYYEYRGQAFGLQYELASAFARSIGTRLRMEAVRDTAELLRRLEQADADLVALELPPDTIAAGGRYLRCGAYTDSVAPGSPPGRRQWLVRTDAPQLADALDKWFRPDVRARLLAAARQQTAASGTVRRRMRAAIQSRRKGVISPYDAHFIRHAPTLGWDWRLLAAQCYQESGFDPQAVSWAGACGLMQIMPATAAHLGLPMAQIHDPALNIQAAVRYLRELNRAFADVTRADERTSFVLAAYNGGAGHVRDAMTLARAAGKDERTWSDVAPFILLLSEPRYYNDPAVKYGYLRGQETYDYVNAIRRRWAQYRSSIRAASSGAVPAPAKRSLKDGKYRSKVVRPGAEAPAENNPQP